MKSEADFHQEAQALGYAPFVRLSPLEYLTLRELHGDWIFTQLFTKLQDPARIHADWAICFAAAAAALPRAEVLGSGDAYGRVVQDPLFKVRTKHLQDFRRTFFERVWRRMKHGARDIPAAERLFYLADYKRWQVKLWRRRHAGCLDHVSRKTEKHCPKKKSPVIEVKRRSLGEAPADSQDQPHSKPRRGVWINPRPGEPIAVRKLS